MLQKLKIFKKESEAEKLFKLKYLPLECVTENYFYALLIIWWDEESEKNYLFMF